MEASVNRCDDCVGGMMRKKHSYMYTVTTKLLLSKERDQREGSHTSIKEQQERLSGPSQRSPVDFVLAGFPDAPEGQSLMMFVWAKARSCIIMAKAAGTRVRMQATKYLRKRVFHLRWHL